MTGSGVVDFERPARIQVSERIVTESGQVDDGIEAFQVVRSNIPNVFANGRDVRTTRSITASLKVTRIESCYFVARGAQHTMHYRSYVTIMAGYQDSHLLSRIFCARPRR